MTRSRSSGGLNHSDYDNNSNEKKISRLMRPTISSHNKINNKNLQNRKKQSYSTRVTQKIIEYCNPYYDVRTLNDSFLISNNEDIILYLNIRNLNAIHLKLLTFVDSLKVKPIYIVCAES
ncbi:hypothetical protein HHI36_007997 [Cryptolaemus montrouzieri]|uniref:Uncharacterized protein n=1 Tax=Cryptolaemus montrouzieri TaxID=559131 RepID=A0ABD2MRR0_9CUCU